MQIAWSAICFFFIRDHFPVESELFVCPHWSLMGNAIPLKVPLRTVQGLQAGKGWGCSHSPGWNKCTTRPFLTSCFFSTGIGWVIKGDKLPPLLWCLSLCSLATCMWICRGSCYESQMQRFWATWGFVTLLQGRKECHQSSYHWKEGMCVQLAEKEDRKFCQHEIKSSWVCVTDLGCIYFKDASLILRYGDGRASTSHGGWPTCNFLFPAIGGVSEKLKGFKYKRQ